MDSVSFHAYTIWLFTYSDLKTVIMPTTTFALLHKAGKAAFSTSKEENNIVRDTVRLLMVMLFAYSNLLPWVMGNQRQTVAIAEDAENKPWRPIPAKRITAAQTSTLMHFLYPVVVLMSVFMGVPFQSLMVVALGVWYNDFNGSDGSFWVRGLINGIGHACALSGGFQIMLRQSVHNNIALVAWFTIIAAAIATTMQLSDFPDQVGDKQRGRKTVPLVLGDGPARWASALIVLWWSTICPLFWSVPAIGFLAPMSLGCWIIYRSLTKRDVKSDKVTSRLWSVWLVMLFSIPLARAWTM